MMDPVEMLNVMDRLIGGRPASAPSGWASLRPQTPTPTVIRREVYTDPECAAMHAAIRAAPDDDLPRLVYADWLEEKGETARAEWVRLCLQTRGPVPYLIRHELFTRAFTVPGVLFCHGGWGSAPTTVPVHAWLARGFVERVGGTLDSLAAVSEHLALTEPLLFGDDGAAHPPRYHRKPTQYLPRPMWPNRHQSHHIRRRIGRRPER
jgi:uncharacterized protein (TIGR02996 family)